MRRILIICSIFLMLILFGCEGKKEEPSSDLSDLGDFPKPIFAQLEKDLNGKNGIVAVFFEKKFKNDLPMIEVTVVFKDEDHPNSIYNILYDIYRFFKYGRVKDIETFRMVFEDETMKKTIRFEFPDVYGDELPYDAVDNLHGSAVVPYEEFEIEDGRPIVFVNTWNHMFSEREPVGPSVLIYDYPVYRGTRETAEKFFSFKFGW